MSLVQGIRFAVDGTFQALKIQKVRKRLFHVLTYLTILAVCSIGLFHLLSLPFAVFGLAFGKTRISSIADYLQNTGLWVIFRGPQFILLCIRYIYPTALDKLFFKTLRSYSKTPEDDVKLKKLERIDRQKWFIRLYHFIFRYFKKAVQISFIWLLSMIPFVGFLVIPAVSFLYLRKSIGHDKSLAILALMIISPPVRRNIKFVLSWVFGFRMFTREVLDPYLYRTNLNSKQVNLRYIFNY
jgi:uncharacterized BrkB/YihY/UPF0761 family membrane protein